MERLRVDWSRYREGNLKSSRRRVSSLTAVVRELEAGALDVISRASERGWDNHWPVIFPPIPPRRWLIPRAPIKRRPGYANNEWTLCVDGSWAFEKWIYTPTLHRRPFGGMIETNVELHRTPTIKWGGCITYEFGGDVVVDLRESELDLDDAMWSLLNLAEFHAVDLSRR